MTSEKAIALINRTISKVVRLTCTDKRVYVGRLMSVDQTKACILQDALELIDVTSDSYLEHELLSPFILEGTKEARWHLKMMGNAVIPGHFVEKI